VTPNAPVVRVGGRVLVVDASDRTLLIHERLEDGTTHWLTPGGGVENGEHPREAAQREALEETGLELDLGPDAEAVLVTRRDWSWAGVDYDQTDHFFLVRVPDGTPAHPHHLTDVERQTWLELRWWPVAEIRASSAVFVPPNLGEVLGDLLRARPGER
jgi:ADP-ribose pyrophosphatase YjhB (NUDIX family)